MYILGDFVSEDEQLDIEYKEYCFKVNVYKFYSKIELSGMIKSGKFDVDFNNIIVANIYKYFDIYIPRYSCSFHNTKTTNKHVLYFGINDYKEITGIPFNGDLCEYSSFFTRYVNMIIATKLDKKCCLNIDLCVEKCVLDEDILTDDIFDRILEFEEEKQKYFKEYSKFVEDKRKWIKKIFKYKSKLDTFLEDGTMINEFEKYLKTQGVYDIFKEEIKQTIHVDLLRIRAKRHNINDIIYWLIKFKDEYAEKIMRVKPKEPKMPKCMNLEFCLITRLSDLRKRFVSSGEISYYVIKLTYSQSSSCLSKIKFRDVRNGQWRSMKRDYIPIGPRCIDM
jgi:hypothetical protein